MFNRMPKSARTHCSGDDQKAYVECNTATRMFCVVVKDVDFINIPEGFPDISIKHNVDRSVSIDFTVSTDNPTAKSQVNNFNAIMGKLNDQSWNSKFYLDRIDFFINHCKRFVEVSLSQSLKSSDERIPHFHEINDRDNLAY